MGESDNSNVDHYVPLAERWDGRRWTVEPTPHGNNWYLYSVSCSSATACVAVGSRLDRAAHRDLTLAERWDGHRWSVQKTANPPSPRNSSLQGVSCSSPKACMAVGYYFDAGNPVPLAERWDGRRWSVQRPANPTGSNETQLYGVSCFSATACTAVGVQAQRTPHPHGATLAERWDGHRWSIQATPNPNGASSGSRPIPHSSVLYGISCPSVKACTATGIGVASFDTGMTLAERWNGNNWSLSRTPHPTHTPSRLGGVSCSSAKLCTAVGDYGYQHGRYTPLIERHS